MRAFTLPTLVLAPLIAFAILASIGALPDRTIVGTARADDLHGTPGPDRILGLAGNDRACGHAGPDEIVGGKGADPVFGGAGNDTLQARDKTRDFLSCGSGHDLAVVDELDQVDSACEIVSRIVHETEPIPLGMPAEIGNGWTLQVVSVVPNATQRILYWDSGNKPPAPGRQYFMARVWAQRTGTGPGYLHAGFRLRATGPSKTKYSTFSDSCGVIPDPNLEFDDPLVFPRGIVEGNVCWSVRASDAWSLVMYPSEGKQVFFALNP